MIEGLRPLEGCSKGFPGFFADSFKVLDRVMKGSKKNYGLSQNEGV